MEELKSGDILVFRAGDNWLSKAIAWLTDSDVSHAAMMLDGIQMVEMGAGGIQVGNVEAKEGNEAMLLRLSPERDPAPLATAAYAYIESRTRYDFPALAYLSGLIIYRRIRLTPKFAAITDIILRGAIAALDKLTQSLILHNPDKAMVCSQLVYQIYEDCGKDYHIKIDGGLLQAKDSLRGPADGVCLADLAAGLKGSDKASQERIADNQIPDAEILAKELYIAMMDAEIENSNDFSAANLDSLVLLTKQLLYKLEEFLEKSKSNMPINALFITPRDLAYESRNLCMSGRLNISRLL